MMPEFADWRVLRIEGPYRYAAEALETAWKLSGSAIFWGDPLRNSQLQ